MPDPPAHVSVRLERTGDAVELSGTPAVPERVRDTRTLPTEKYIGLALAQGFLSLWTCGVVVIFGFGVVFCFVALGLILFADVPFNIAGQPQRASTAAAVLLGFLTIWIAVGGTMLWWARRMRRVRLVLSGRRAAQQWRLRVEPREIEAIQEQMGVTTSRRRCKPEEIRSLVITPEGYLVAELVDAVGTPVSEMVLAGPLAQQDADWLADAMRRLLGLRR